MNEMLIVDGYNIIGAWPELRDLAAHELEDARDRLIELMANFQGHMGWKVIIVFDAHQVPGLGAKLKQSKVDILYTKEKETADECIERLVAQYSHRRRRIHVATSDYVEQRVIFGQGALRISARELLLQVMEGQRAIRKQIDEQAYSGRHNTFDHRLNPDIRDILEKWRRGK